MALSEREQKLLHQMEQALYAEDPRFATRIRSASAGRSRTRLLVGALGVVVGLGLVVLGVLNQLIWLGAAGFLVMVAAGAYAFAPEKRQGPSGLVDAAGRVRPSPGQAPRGQRQRQRSASFMKRLEDRWDRRNRDQW